ncbi:protein kinase domain-containing protein [Streptomyces sp. NPDC002755]|uniref:protein kinase domain-containing protein n=1 Tax=Streptomyces sp. NPDC002884 TaxID=3154544 RepID=UPI00331CC466
MSDPHHIRSHALAYAAAGMEPPPPAPLRKSDPVRVGPYLLVSVLGSGGMGRVYLGRNTEGGPGPAAVKVIRPEYAEDPRFRKRFAREVDALGSVQGAHTVRLMGSGSDEDLLWVATEYIPGPTLEDAVEKRGPLDAAAAWRLMADLGRAVEAMWRAGIVHRDLKPSNVILAADGARVIDFGVVQASDGTSITTTGQNVGTIAFMSPEQVRGQAVTAASDVFTLASTLTYAVAGEAPFGEGTGVDVLHRVAFDPPREDVLDKVAAVDAELASFVRRCLDKDAELRPAPDVVFRTAIGHQLSAPADPRPSAADPRRSPSSPAGTAFPAAGARPGSTPGGAPAPGDPPSAPRREPPSAPPASAAAPAVLAATAARGRHRRNIVLAAAVAALVTGGLTVALLYPADAPASAAPGQASTPAVTAPAASAPGASPKATSPAPVATASGAGGSAAATPSGTTATRDALPLDLRAAECLVEIVSGSSGNCVAALQRLLAGYGLDVTTDGRFGARTLAAVKVFQTAAGLTADGKVDQKTRALLYSSPGGAVRTGTVTVTESVDTVDVARCLDADTGTANSEDQTVQVWECTGASQQEWALYPVPGRTSQYTVVNQGNHRCLDADAAGAGRNGHGIHSSRCDGLAAQRWRLGASAGSGVQMVSVPDGFCLDAEATSSGQDGQRVQAWSCAGNTNQAWTWR